MKAIVRSLLLGAVSLVSVSSATLAADMDGPFYEAPPEIEPVEVGNGWYLRGDVAYDFKTDVDVDYQTFSRALEPNFYPLVPISYGAESYDEFEIKDGPAFSLGAGYQFTDMFRGDLTAHYWKQDVDGSDLRAGPCAPLSSPLGTGCLASDTGDVRAWELMANAYVDLGNFAGFTPYVGAGAGAVHLDYSSLRSENACVGGVAACGNTGNVTIAQEGLDSWRFAYAAMAGVSYDINQTLKLDIGYRYLNVDGGDAYSFATTSINRGASGLQATDDGFDRHTIQAGLRYSLF
ncbi:MULTISPECIES: outer membrane protein [unclassified Aureimonas]|uniref:outer membrane protein n=1 Tax=unclassified Aureimonas TaxID=2615206 RepID=UPI0007015D98|nr:MULTISPECIES: outer membrane beta-barrel protein [unclassified Aureimonas]KQT55163.1 hypothetical protein ASG62_09935 [Aureimonas sp. Leaf427]KQT70952.1 hypothetical protein ASG54_20320 [Aureimonas sp. Leaf460]